MTTELSKTQVDRLGDRLKKENIEEADLRLLDLYRRSFTPAYEFVVGAIREELTLEPTGRPSKTTTSIVDKLRRESIRLTQIQDIAGCRLIVADIATQNTVVQSLNELFEHTAIVDRRERPSHGYRAVHVIVKIEGVAVEVQIRTSLQHLWAELSEKFSDVFDSSIKYGGGSENMQTFLMDAAALFARIEHLEPQLAEAQLQMSLPDDISNGEKLELANAQQTINLVRHEAYELFRTTIEELKERRGN